MATEEVVLRLTLQQRRETAKGLRDTAGDVQSIGDAAEAAGRRIRNGLGSALRSIGGMVVSAAKYGTAALGALATAGAGWGVKVAAANEQADISFTTMLGSAEKAGSFLADLQKFAAETPFDMPGLQKSASSLISVGIHADRVIPIMTSLGNATSGMNTGAEGIQRATVALQQMNAAGRITGEDLNQLRDAGVPVFDLLAAATGKSTKAVAELAQKGKLGARELEQLMGALESGKGLERFSGLMEKQSASLTGMWSSFTDTIGQGAARVMDPWLPVMKRALGDATGAATPFFDTLTAKSAELAQKAPVWIARVRQVLRDAKVEAQEFIAGFKGERTSGDLAQIGQSVRVIVDNIRGADVGALFGNTSSVLPAINSGLKVTGVVTGFLADHLDALGDAMPYLVAGYVALKVAQVGANLASAASTVIRMREVAATRALASSNRQLATAQGQAAVATGRATAADNTSILTRARSSAAMVGQKAKLVALRTATVAYTTAQRLMNLAMRANPIGLIVTAIAGLAGGVVYAYEKFEWFRDVIGWVWDKLKAFWDWVTGVGDAIAGFFGFGGDDDSGSGGGGGKVPGRAIGGNVKANQPYIVGERRRELFVPRVDGTIIPRIPTPRDDTDGALAGLASGLGGPVHVHVEVDGREIGTAVIYDWRDRQARK